MKITTITLTILGSVSIAVTAMTAPAHARLSDSIDAISNASGSMILVDAKSGQSCFLKNIDAKSAPRASVVPEISAQAEQVATSVANTQKMQACSAEQRDSARDLIAAVENGNRTAVAPLVLWGAGMAAYWALCTGVNVKMVQTDTSTAWTTASWTVCAPASGVNLGIFVVFIAPNLKFY